MATIHFVDANNNIRQAYSFSSQIVPRCITVCDQNGTKHYIPTDGSGATTYDEDMGTYINRYSYSSSIPSLHAVYAGGTVANAYNAVSTISKVSIPAGTYSPSTFRSMIQNFIPANGSRRTRYAFSVEVNGGRYDVWAGQEIKYCTTNTAGSGTSSSLEIVTFNGSNTVQAMDTQTFRGTYVVYGTSYSGHALFSEYFMFNITVLDDIYFI